MKFFLITLLFLFQCYFHLKSQPVIHEPVREKITDDLYSKEIYDSVFIITHYFPGAGNSLVVILSGNKAVLLDTPYEPRATKCLHDWMNQKFGHLEIISIITGYHQDNLGGNEYLISKGIPVYGSDLTAKLVKEKGQEFKNLIMQSVEKEENKIYYDAFKALNFTPPNKVFPIQKGLLLKIGEETIEAYFPGESHDIDNIVVYLHHKKILFGGCMLKGMNFNNPGFIAFANMEEWPHAIERVMKRFPDCHIVVPGHGIEGGFETFSHMLEVLNTWEKEHN